WDNYLLPFVENMRELCEQPDGAFYLVTDGEPVQMAPLDDPALLARLNEARIDVGKGPASCSGVCGNALDVSDTFKAVKGRLRKSHAADMSMPTADILEQRVYKLLQPLLSEDKPLWRKKAARSIMHIIAMESLSLKPSTIQNGFRRIGMIPVE